MTLRKMLAGAAVAVAALAFAPTSSSSQAAALEDFGGMWQFTGSSRDRQALEDGIDRVADQLNIFIREIARGEMRRRIQPENRIRFRVPSETSIEIAVDDWGPVTFQLGASPRGVRGPGGDQIRVTLNYLRGRIVHRELADQGTRTNVFLLSPDGQRMTMAATIGSNQLPDDIRYRLSYRRVR